MGILPSKPIFFQWASRAERKLPKPSLLEHDYHYDGKVIIIGAGASGLAAARILQEHNIEFTILEATDRLGGRLKEDTSFANFPVDLGAEWIHNLPSILDVLSGEPNKHQEIDLVRNWYTDTCSWDGGEKLKQHAGYFFPLFHRFMPEYKFQTSTWYDFVTKNVAAKHVEDHIRFNAPVSKIDYRGSKVVVTTQDGQQHEADKVIITASVGVLRSGNVHFVPDLPQDKKKALENIHFPKGFKLALKFSKKFYPDFIVGPVPLGKGEMGYYDMAFGKGDKADCVATLLATGAGAESYYSVGSEKAIVQKALQELDAMYGGEATRSFTGEYRFQDWGNHEFTQGTWVEGFRISKKMLRSLARPLEDKVYFAGEVLDTYQQLGVPGAILSGYKAISDMLAP